MKKLKSFLCAAAVAGAFLFGASTAEAEGPAMWRIETPNNTIHIFGSVHALKDTPKYPKKVLDAFDKADNLVLELDLRDYGQTYRTKMEEKTAILRPGWKLRDIIGPQLYYKTQVRAGEYMLDMTYLDMLAPFAVAEILMMMPPMDAAPVEVDDWVLRENGVETYFEKRAQRAGKEILELEDLEVQMKIFAGLDMEMQKLYLEDFLEDDTPSYKRQKWFDDTVKYWSEGNVEKLGELILEEQFDMIDPDLAQAVYDRILVQRNENWVPVIEGYMNQKQDYFVIAGAAHFIGEHWVIKLLRDRGYYVERVN